MTNEKILLTRLYERVSAKGTRYLNGRFALGKLVAFQGQPTPDGTPTWDVYLTPGADQQQARQQPAGGYQRAAAPRPSAVRAPAPAGADDGAPFDDGIPF